MKYRNLGRTGLKVSALNLGGWTTFGDSLRDRTAVQIIIATPCDRSVKFFDTADACACGESARTMDEALATLDELFPPLRAPS